MSLLVEIHKRFGSFSLDVKFETDGGVTGLLGASGSGKSMTLMCIAGIVKPDSGRIVLDGRILFDSARRIDLAPQRRRVGYLFQNYALFPHMTVLQNILCSLHGEKSKEKRARADEIVNIMQLDGLERRKPAQLSGGQRQRVALARILVGAPDILMLDEPFSALDSHLRGQLQIETQRLMGQFCGRGKDALLVTHDRDEAYRLCDRLAVIDGGRVIAHERTAALFANPGSVRAALLTGCKNVVTARKTGEREAEIPAWGIRLETAQPLQDGLCAVGIRAHHFAPDAPNRFPVRFTGEMEEPFELILQFRFHNQAPESPDVWWRLPKGLARPDALGVAPMDVLPLYM